MCLSYTYMELRHLRYFVMAAEELNISRASARLKISQPAVSRQIKDLEEELGVQLFERLRDGLELTEAGHSALAHAHEVLRQAVAMEDAMTLFQHTEKGMSITIGYISTALPGFLANGLRQFRREHSNVRIEIHEMHPRDQERALRDNGLDLALLGTPSKELKKKYSFRVIRKVPLAIVLPVEHSLSKRKTLDLSELAKEPFVTLHDKQFPGRSAMTKDLFEQAGITPVSVQAANGLSELLGLVGAGTGVALAPADLDQLPHSGVCFVKLRHPALTLLSSAVWKAERETPELLALVDIMKSRSPG
jgi:DNA-binding transcriptional LysR family regulator